MTVHTLHPGVVRTNFGRATGGWFQALTKIMSPFYRSAKKGADTMIWLAASESLNGVSGKYYLDRKAIKSQPFSYDIAAQDRLWAVTEEMTKVRVR